MATTASSSKIKATDLTDAQLLTLISGHDFWQSEALPDAHIPAIRMSDGPHGLRYQAGEGDHLGINESAKATAFPTASASANSWDPDLLRQMGEAIGQEARSLGVDIVLGPGVNIKRNPLGGRNFEYFSEDPYLAGTLAAAWIRGLQSAGAGASLKHFAGNNQEAVRLLSDSLIDPVALHELYLEAFRIAVTTSQPETVMNSYNKVNGTYMSEHDYLLNTVLRGQWGFKGAVITDWGALDDPVKSLNAGTDLEMPGDEHFFRPVLKKALRNGDLNRAALTRAGEKLIRIATKDRPKAPADRDTLLSDHAKLAETIAEQSAVLLKNKDQVLPLHTDTPVLLVGAMADETRYQGVGSSHINPVSHVSIKAGLEAAGITVHYEPGYADDTTSPELRAAAVEAAATAEQVIVVVGLPEAAESEGFDRSDMKLPAAQNALVTALAAVNPHVVVLLVAGAPVELPWREQVAGLMALYLGGQEIGTAAARLLFGTVSPSGHLAETYPMAYADVPSSALFGQNPHSVPYAESLYVGYRYYDKADVPVAYPFGFGLSYTTFDYSDITLQPTTITADTAADTTAVTVRLTVTNTGTLPGATVVQAYVGDSEQLRLTPRKALKGYRKIFLEPGASSTVTVDLPLQAFCHWREDQQRWALTSSAYNVFIALDSQTILQQFSVTATGEPADDISTTNSAPAATASDTPAVRDTSNVPAWYQQPRGLPSVSDFTALSGYHVAPVPIPQAGHLTAMNTPRELSRFSRIVAKFTQIMLKQKLDAAGNPPDSPESNFLRLTILDTPLVRLAQQSSGLLKPWHVRLLVGLANQPVRSKLFRKGGAR
jgi:beta-glucosidase